MPAVVYPYAILAGRRSPLIPLGLRYQGRWQRVQAYVDSGAFYSVFKTDFALPLGLAWQEGECVYVQVGDVASFLSTCTSWMYNSNAIVSPAALGSLTTLEYVLTSLGVSLCSKDLLSVLMIGRVLSVSNLIKIMRTLVDC